MEPRSFTVRIWSERVGTRVERRGSVRAVRTGAFRNFREWSDLTSFLDQHLEDDRPMEAPHTSKEQAPW